MSIKVVYFYDTTSPEADEAGEFDSTGNDFRTYHYREEEAEEAVSHFVELYQNEGLWDESEHDVSVNQICYAADPVYVDYKTGKKDWNRIAIIVEGRELKQKTQKLLEQKLGVSV